MRVWLIERQLVDPHEPRMLRGSVWSKHFDAVLQVEAERLADSAQDPCDGDSMRVDLTHLSSYTLDDAGTREIDDALSLERRGDQPGCGFTSPIPRV